MSDNKNTTSTNQLDLLTIVSISIIVFVIQNVLHEIIGHGGATWLVGGKVISATTAYLENDLSSVSSFRNRIVSAAGPIINLFIGLIAWLMLKAYQNKQNNVTFFFWLTMTVNLFTGTGYFFFSGISGIGDLIDVINGASQLWIWRIGMIAAGIVSYFAAILLSLKELNQFLRHSNQNRKKDALKLTLVPFFAGSIASTIGAFFNPTSFLFVLTSAASTFGGTSGLGWMSQLLTTKWFPINENSSIEINRSWFWIMLSGIFLLVHIFIIGPGIYF